MVGGRNGQTQGPHYVGVTPPHTPAVLHADCGSSPLIHGALRLGETALEFALLGQRLRCYERPNPPAAVDHQAAHGRGAPRSGGCIWAVAGKSRESKSPRDYHQW
jgi:hypothetical protein